MLDQIGFVFVSVAQQFNRNDVDGKANPQRDLVILPSSSERSQPQIVGIQDLATYLNGRATMFLISTILPLGRGRKRAADFFAIASIRAFEQLQTLPFSGIDQDRIMPPSDPWRYGRTVWIGLESNGQLGESWNRAHPAAHGFSAPLQLSKTGRCIGTRRLSAASVHSLHYDLYRFVRFPSIKSRTARAASSTLVPGPNTAATPLSSKNW